MWGKRDKCTTITSPPSSLSSTLTTLCRPSMPYRKRRVQPSSLSVVHKPSWLFTPIPAHPLLFSISVTPFSQSSQDVSRIAIAWNMPGTTRNRRRPHNGNNTLDASRAPGEGWFIFHSRTIFSAEYIDHRHHRTYVVLCTTLLLLLWPYEQNSRWASGAGGPDQFKYCNSFWRSVVQWIVSKKDVWRGWRINLTKCITSWRRTRTKSVTIQYPSVKEW